MNTNFMYRRSLYRAYLLALPLLLPAMFLGCNALQGVLGLQPRDIRPPVLLEQQSFEDYFVFIFDEPLAKGSFTEIQPELPHDSTSIEGKTLTIRLAKKTVPGKAYLLRATVHDANDNALNFLVRLYGENKNPASLIINELNPEGSKSSNSPEVVEFYVLESGNLGGLTFTVGSLKENKGNFVFPAMHVVKGDFILLHTRWDAKHKKDITRIDETQSKNRAKARLSSDKAWDLWAPKISGLSDTNNALAIYESLQGTLQDVVIYSTSVTAEKYRGWKTSYLERQIDRLAEGWRGVTNAKPKVLMPEDAIRSRDSTGTRSLSRLHSKGIPTDSDSAADWIIVDKGKYSFGEINSLERYNKKPKSVAEK